MDPKYPVYLTIAVIIGALVFVFLPDRSVVSVTEISATNSEVSATFVNEGDPIDVAYWVEFGPTGMRQCPGRIALGANERKAVKWDCPALAGQSGQFRVVTGPAS